jgi:hypothetical protein
MHSTPTRHTPQVVEPPNLIYGGILQPGCQRRHPQFVKKVRAKIYVPRK